MNKNAIPVEEIAYLREFFVYFSDSVLELCVLIGYESKFRNISGSVPSVIEIP